MNIDRRHILNVSAMALVWAMALTWILAIGSATAQGAPPRPGLTLEANAPEKPSRELTVSLITCWPGPEVYELCGHAAIRVRGEGIDSVWNYGLFDFAAPNFLYRFVKGETDYMVAGYPFEWFLPEYERRGSKVVEQDLNLTPREASRMLAMLREESLPQNCTYRYNYVRNNCSTRILDRLEEASESRLIYPDSVRYGTFRREMRAYHRDYPWYQFGIDLALGSGLDRRIDSRGEMFVPMESARNLRSARYADGRPAVKAERVLTEGVPDATLGPSPWYTGPLFVFLIVLALTALAAVLMLRRGRLLKWVYSVWFGALGLVGCLSVFLVFVSEHEATSPNILVLWLNPLQLIVGAGVWWRRWRLAVGAVCLYDVAAVGIEGLAWVFQAQSGNPAIFPVMGTTFLLAAAGAIITLKKGYNINGEERRSPRAKAAGRASTPGRRRK